MATYSPSCCPCGSTHTYSQCCQPLHQQKKVATTARQLMRSRYSAFALRQIDYLLTTHHPDFHSPNEEQILQQTLQDSQWIDLTVINHHAGSADDTQGTVEFKALCQEGKHISELYACSNFIKEDGLWYYTDDKFRYLKQIKIGRNDLCWCGSGKKYKKCHGSQAS